MKKILIAVLALAVVFGFAACDNESGSGAASVNDMYVVSIAVQGEGGQYFDGETISTSDFTVIATRNNNETFTVPSSDLVFEGGDDTYKIDKSVTANTNITSGDIARIMYVGPYSMPTGSSVYDMIEGSVYKLDAIKVTGTPSAQLYVGATEKDIVKGDFTVVAQAKNNDEVVYERTLPADDFTVTGTFSAAGPKELTFAPKYISTSVNGEATVSVLPNYITSVTAKQATVEDLIDEESFTVSSTYKAAILGGTTLADPTEYFVVTYTLANGKTVEADKLATYGVTAAKVTWNMTDVTGFTAGTSKFDKETAYKLNVEYKKGANAEAAKEPITLTPVDNYILKFTVAASGEIEALTKLTADSVTITPTWADANATKTYTDSQLKSALRFDGNPDYTVPAGYPVNTALTCKITLDGIDALYDDTTPLTTKAN